jgi:predicted MFS family arabinose efflux permease
MGIKLFISVSQLLMPFFLGVAAGTSMSYLSLAIVAGIAIAVLGVLAIFAPFPESSQSGKNESFIENLKNANFSLESVALILIGFTSTATFQLWLNCAQTFGKEIAGIPSESVSVMQTYYSAGTLVALFVTSALITKFKQVRFLVIYPAISVVMLVLVYLIKSPMICYVGAFVIGYAAAGGVLQMATATVNDLFPNIKGTITSLVMIASSLCNYTILSAASKMTATSVIMMNIVITVIGVLLAIFVNMRYGTLLNKANQE